LKPDGRDASAARFVVVIDEIKSYQRREESDIRFSQLIAYKQPLFPKPILQRCISTAPTRTKFWSIAAAPW
jgi:hypothetical protein